MPAAADQRLTILERRRARRLAYWNGAVWGVGNGLLGSTLVVYLAEQLGAPRIGLGVGLILAARHVVGVLRLGAPAMIGRLADRKRWMTLGVAAGALAAGAFAWGWLELHPPPSPKWIAYAIPAVVGAGLIGASITPLMLMPRAARCRIVLRGATFAELLAPFRDSQFLRLLAFGCWFSFFNGVTQSAQNLYPIRVLEIGLFVILALQTGMRGGQLTVSP
jgi:hypothetical protein